MTLNNVHYTQISARIEGSIVSTEEIRVYYDIHGLNRTSLYYRVTNEETKENPAMVPYTDLPPHQRAKDAALKAMVATIKKQCLVTFPYIRPDDTITPVTGEEPAQEEKPKTSAAITG